MGVGLVRSNCRSAPGVFRISEKSFYYWLRKLRSHMAEATSPQLVQLEPPAISDDMLQIQYRGAELKLPAGVDIEAVAVLLRSLQSL